MLCYHYLCNNICQYAEKHGAGFLIQSPKLSIACIATKNNPKTARQCA